ncbi:uncharacterized protein LOC101458578 [Ceratitis capitata]|uniref:uncharacterized protein LOC101458578 n=1 Tax=Ceratitis capitata TaxID=7213 RepID=UPI00032A2DB8|nr:uncharacterized protein LOC101458578 [Ceratitis capitata]
MFRLHYAVKVLIRSHRLPNPLTTVLRVISTTAPKPNFGSLELPWATNEVLHTIEKTEDRAVVNGSGAGKSDNNGSDEKSSKGNDELPKLPVSDEKKLPDVTIVDINGGYGRMDFEDRMEHMDRSDRINEAKQSNNACGESVIPIIRTMPRVDNIDGYGDDMMYEDKAEWELASKPEVKQEKETDSNSKTTDLTAANTETTAVSDVAYNKSSDTELPPKQRLHANRSDEVAEIAVLTHPTSEATAATASSNKEVEIICEAPVDIDAFANEQESKQGTVDINAYEDDERFKLPQIPKVRNNVFVFRGIKIIMPKRMLRDATYRYRLDPSDKDKPDDMQICVFEKLTRRTQCD